jgi:hypothetical protein
MFTKISAAVLVVLALSPFTAPFATCDLAALFHPHHSTGRTPSLETVVRSDAESEALVIPTLMTRAGDVRVALVFVVDAAPAEPLLTFIPPATAGVPGIRHLATQPVNAPRTSSVLRV